MLKLALVTLFCVALLSAGVSAQKAKKAKVAKEPKAPKAPSPKRCKSVVKTAQSTKLNLLLELVTAAGLGELLDDEDGDFTIFAPTDKAIEAALKALKVSKKDFVANKDLLAEILTYHVLPTAYTAEELAAFGPEGLPTLLGYDGSCSVTDVGFQFTKKAATIVGGETNAVVVTPDVQACSNIVHVIDTVLVPCPIADASDAKEIANKKKAAAKEEETDGEEEPEEEDVEEEEEATAKGKGKAKTKVTKVAKAKAEAKVEEEADVEDEEVAEVVEDEEEDTKEKSDPLCEPVLSSLIPTSKTLVKALTVSGLSKAIDDKEAGITLFAPTDKAFETAAEALGLTVRKLLRERTLLKEILQFHVLRKSLTSSDFKKGPYTTLLGKNSSCKNSSLDIKVAKKKITVDGGLNSATVVEGDVDACSSTIHFIDNVLLPCEIDLPGDEE